MKPSKNKDRRSQGTFEHNNSNLMIKKIREKSQNWLVINYFCRIEINMIVKYNSCLGRLPQIRWSVISGIEKILQKLVPSVE